MSHLSYLNFGFKAEKITTMVTNRVFFISISVPYVAISYGYFRTYQFGIFFTRLIHIH